MSDDQSFYEIQLNWPHLVLAFLGAAVVGVAVFWLGVVIGHGQSEVGGPSEWQAAAPVQKTQQTEADTGEDQLGFYDDVNEPVAKDEPTVDDTGGADPVADPPVSEPETSSPPPDEFQPADPVDEPRDPVVADSASDLPRPDASLVTGWIVQVRSTPDRTAADALQSALVMAGFPAFVVSADVNGETWHRVRVGRYVSKSDAEIVEARLGTHPDVESTWVTEG